MFLNSTHAKNTITTSQASNNNKPTAFNDLNNTMADIPVSGNVLTNDFDIDNSGSLSVSALGQPLHGTLSLNPDGSYTYTPDSEYVGADYFQYVLNDQDGQQALTDTAMVCINVMRYNTTHDKPIANDDFALTYLNMPIFTNALVNDFDPDGDPLLIGHVLVSTPQNGMVSMNPDGSYIYFPNPGFTGMDCFSYTLYENKVDGSADTATVCITVADNTGLTNLPPFAGDDAQILLRNTFLTGSVIENDFDLDGNALVVNPMPIQQPANGTLFLNPDGSYLYTPNAGYVGPDYFIYEICDNGTDAQCRQATAYITVLPDNVEPFPVEYLSFSAEWANQQAVIEWVTASETNSDYFEIERSMDGTNFGSIGMLQSAGNTTETTHYQFVDTDAFAPNQPTIYYRLKQVDFDGQFSYSTIVELNPSDTELPFQTSLYPNPASEHSFLRFESPVASRVSIQIAQTNGQIVWAKKLESLELTKQLELPLQTLTKGLYFVRISTLGQSHTHKLIVE